VVLALAAAGATAQPRPEGRFIRGELGTRSYRLYVPRAALGAPGDAGPSLPLVVALHGCWQTAEDFAVGTRLNEAAERRRLLVIYPAQGTRNNASRCWNWFEPPSAHGGEAGEILAIVRRVASERRAARGRIVALGFSAGGFMAVNLACVAPDTIAGVGVVAGGPFRCGAGLAAGLACMRGQQVSGEQSAAACREAMGPLARPLRASLWHGGQDVVVNAVNLHALAAMFARLDRVTTTAAEQSEQALRTVYRDASGRAAVESWLIPGMGHAWSGGDPRGTHTYPPGPAATDRILDFLLE
jgi:poly(hydroxyalkanoate) depolymerase family esterase